MEEKIITITELAETFDGDVFGYCLVMADSEEEAKKNDKLNDIYEEYYYDCVKTITFDEFMYRTYLPLVNGDIDSKYIQELIKNNIVIIEEDCFSDYADCLLN